MENRHKNVLEKGNRPLIIKSREEFSQKTELHALVHHMAAISNLPEIFRENAILPYNIMQSRRYTRLDNEDVQAGRASVVVPQTGKALHDYVPLYLSYKTPMAAANQHRNEEWGYLTFSLVDLVNSIGNIVITDGNARSSLTKFQLVTSLDDFAILDVKAINSVSYGKDNELRRKKQAEMLIPNRLPLQNLLWISVINNIARAKVETIAGGYNHKIKVQVREGWYFQ